MGKPTLEKSRKTQPSSTKGKNRKAQSSNYKNNKGGGFNDVRKKKAINSYKKTLRKEHRDEALYEVIKRQKSKKSGYKTDTYLKINKEAEEKRQKAEDERIKREEEKQEKIKQREEGKAAAAEKRRQRQKLFSKKTRKGQPHLHNHMALLLEKIEKSVKHESSHPQSSSKPDTLSDG